MISGIKVISFMGDNQVSGVWCCAPCCWFCRGVGEAGRFFLGIDKGWEDVQYEKVERFLRDPFSIDEDALYNLYWLFSTVYRLTSTYCLQQNVRIWIYWIYGLLDISVKNPLSNNNFLLL